MTRWIVVYAWLGIFLAGCGGDRTDIPARDDYREVVARLTTFIEHEMTDKDLPALSIALVDDQETVWATGFGWAHPDDSVPATAETVYRVGSVSKLFTDLGVMQLVERGALSLDAPVGEYLPAFSPEGDGRGRATLRQLMSHRAGLVREPPVGHYFDDTDVSLTATVESLNGTGIVYEPGSRIKYSNAGIATVGYVLERTQHTAFAPYLEDAVLEPLGMDRSSFSPRPDLMEDLATAYMWTYDGRTFEAPGFQLGMAPAGSMYSTVTELGRFLHAVFAGGVGTRGRVVEAATLDTMLSPQFASPGATTGYGLGFGLGTLDGMTRIGHGGAIYGFATDLGALPDQKLAAVAVTTTDGANTVVRRITDYALRLMVAARDGGPLPDPVVTTAVSPSDADRWVGSFGAGDARVDISREGDDLYALFSDRRLRLRQLGPDVVTDDRLGFGRALHLVDPDRLVMGGDTLTRNPDAPPAPPPARWLDLIGEYGWDYNTLYIYEHDGRLHALIEWFFIDPLEEIAPDVFAFPNRGLYHGERLRFARNDAGRVDGVVAAGIRFDRRPVAEAGATFTIDPLRPVRDLRRDALAATPPVEDGEFAVSDLVELRSVDPSIAYDIRYATTNNFMRSVFYDEPRALMQRPAAEALARAHRRLRAFGYGLLVHDAYRPWYVTKMFWDATPADLKMFVANPDNGSRHNRGAAVDLTLYDLESRDPIPMVGGYDEFSDRAFPNYSGGTERQRWHRDLLRRTMEAEGFNVYEFEWWHFDYGDWARYPIQNATFDELADGN